MSGEVLELRSERDRRLGEERVIKLYNALTNLGRDSDFDKAINDKDEREKLFKEFNL